VIVFDCECKMADMAASYREVLARNIRAERARAGLSQQGLADRMRALGFDAWMHQTVGSVERGKRRVMAEEILGLAIAVDTSISRLMEPAKSDEAVELPSGVTITVSAVLARLSRAAREDAANPLPLCYNPHLNRHDQGLPNPKYLPHVHVRKIDHGGRPVAVIWEEP
jgi:transcriptional regulator with XRE-family HTH domain